MEDGNTNANDDHAGEPVRVSEQSSTQQLEVPTSSKNLEVPAPASDNGSRRGPGEWPFELLSGAAVAEKADQRHGVWVLRNW